MTPLLDLCPAPPRWAVDVPALEEAFPALRTLGTCPQDPVHHGEGDVLVHTRMTLEALAADPAWRGQEAGRRVVLFLAALVHDIGKPDCTRVADDGSVSCLGHSRRGAILGRALLWEAGVPFPVREAALALVRHHQLPFFALEAEDPRPRVYRASLSARLDDLAILAAADVRGRVCSDSDRLLENVELFRLYCSEQECLDRARAFPSAHSRFLYFRVPGRDPAYLAHEEPRCRVVVLSGLPGSGKDRWLSRNLPERPVVSLDAIREEAGVDPEEPQGPVVAAAREQVRVHLRRSEDFVLNATNLSRDVRGRWIDLLADYSAQVRVVYVESPASRLWQQNRERPRPVPESALRRLLDRWEVPEPWEAHAMEWVAGGPGGISSPPPSRGRTS